MRGCIIRYFPPAARQQRLGAAAVVGRLPLRPVVAQVRSAGIVTMSCTRDRITPNGDFLTKSRQVQTSPKTSMCAPL